MMLLPRVSALGATLFMLGVATSAHAWVVVGNIATQNTGRGGQRSEEIFNSAALINPAGEWVARYDKVHLVPFGEYVPFKTLLSFAGGLTKEVGDFTGGAVRTPLLAGDEKLGVFICYESIFPDEVRHLAGNGAQVLVNISNDGWYGDSGAYAQHLKQARMRAIENDRWLLRDTNTGVTAVIVQTRMKRTSFVQAVRAASSAEASSVISTGSPSRGKTHASKPFIPQKFVR